MFFPTGTKTTLILSAIDFKPFHVFNGVYRDFPVRRPVVVTHASPHARIQVKEMADPSHVQYMLWLSVTLPVEMETTPLNKVET